ncbi:hypothetical protein VNO78_12992 [Psophocarpus tetragonolobus]|uniref:Transmembrane protein n=1 Tax=Psophocarpus tetragonolobus TaxID=3891 RepID=A0AAN9SPM0_PSOTE
MKISLGWLSNSCRRQWISDVVLLASVTCNVLNLWYLITVMISYDVLNLTKEFYVWFVLWWCLVLDEPEDSWGSLLDNI